MATGIECCAACAWCTPLLVTLMNCYQNMCGGGANMGCDCTIENICNFMSCCQRCNCCQHSPTNINVTGNYTQGGNTDETTISSAPQTAQTTTTSRGNRAGLAAISSGATGNASISAPALAVREVVLKQPGRILVSDV